MQNNLSVVIGNAENLSDASVQPTDCDKVFIAVHSEAGADW